MRHALLPGNEIRLLTLSDLAGDVTVVIGFMLN
jgi:hypothetical protein